VLVSDGSKKPTQEKRTSRQYRCEQNPHNDAIQTNPIRLHLSMMGYEEFNFPNTPDILKGIG
jgi:hypothetical protein